jgi:hypothetical protein
MLILFDHGVPRGLAGALRSHAIITAHEKGWDTLTNGALLKTAEEARVELLLTTDRRLRYQQNLKGRKISIIVLTGTTKWSQVRLHFARITAAVNACPAGEYKEVEIPFAARQKQASRNRAGASEIETI